LLIIFVIARLVSLDDHRVFGWLQLVQSSCCSFLLLLVMFLVLGGVRASTMTLKSVNGMCIKGWMG